MLRESGGTGFDVGLFFQSGGSAGFCSRPFCLPNHLGYNL